MRTVENALHIHVSDHQFHVMVLINGQYSEMLHYTWDDVLGLIRLMNCTRHKYTVFVR